MFLRNIITDAYLQFRRVKHVSIVYCRCGDNYTLYQCLPDGKVKSWNIILYWYHPYYRRLNYIFR